jgi:hypothetical protein
VIASWWTSKETFETADSNEEFVEYYYVHDSRNELIIRYLCCAANAFTAKVSNLKRLLRREHTDKVGVLFNIINLSKQC